MGRVVAGVSGEGRPAYGLRESVAVVAVAVLAVWLGTETTAHAKPRWTPYDRPPEHGVVTDSNVPIEMRDGVVLRANVERPASPGRFPALVIQTPYNKDGAINAFLGGTATYFAQRGYAVVTVDVRGTGSSQGRWDSFGEDEQRDGPEVVRWTARQGWSSGKVGLFGPSYMGLNQIYTAAHRPRALKAIFPIVPMADGYRDITFSGGQVNVSFIPLWLGLVTAGSLTPTAVDASNPLGGLLETVDMLVSRIAGVVDFQLATVVDAAAGGETAFDGPFWAERSPIEVVDRIRVPAFVVGGHHDLFQRGEPLLYERLKQRVPARLLMGPWTHVGGATGEGLPRDGVPSLNQIALRWFDRWLRGERTRVGRIPRVTQYILGAERYATQRDWPAPNLRPRSMFLRGGGALRGRRASADEQRQGFLQHPLSGICTQSIGQWTAGLLDPLPCTQDNRLNELGEATYTTAPLKRALRLSGPALADLWVSTSARDAVLSVRLTDVAPDGTSREITSGWLAGSLRKVDRSRSRIVRGRLIQPWHPFTRESMTLLEPGVPTRMRVEIFPTRANIRPGHRLRVSVGPSDFPHQVPPLPQLANSLLGQVRIHTGPEHRSRLVLPRLGRCNGRCRPLAVPNLRRRG